MNFTLIICTYKRAQAVVGLLNSVTEQTLHPNEILIVDGSPDNGTQLALEEAGFKNVVYYHVNPEYRGLTRQRNFGISKVNLHSEVVCFLDDDVILEKDYFEKLLSTYQIYPEALGAGGYITNKVKFEWVGDNVPVAINEFYYDGWKRKDGNRFILRKKLSLDSDCPPGYSPLFSHGRSVGFLPPSGKIYPVEQLMGGVSSFRKSVFDCFKFSTYFEGYSLYEDADFSIRVAKKGELFINTSARLEHHHELSGRPNAYRYGKMVVRNGWYVWRTKNPNPQIKDSFKWHSITTLLTVIRYSNAITSNAKKQALTEAVGRTAGWLSLLWDKPKKDN